MKIAIIGGGSTYTPELIEGFIQYQDQIHVDTIVLMDLYDWRLKIVGDLAQRMLQRGGSQIQLELTTDRIAALEGADFVITQIRVGGMAARQADESIPLRYGVIGQETVGPGGFAKALRTVPVMLDIAHDIELVAPQATLINFTNPSGLITEAIRSQSPIKTIGLCNLPTNMGREIASQLHADSQDVKLDYIGLNHLGWVRGVTVQGQDCSAQALQAAVDFAAQEHDPVFSPELLTTLGLIPGYYLAFYYYPDRMLAYQRQASQTRAERAREIEKELLQLYADPGLDKKPALLAERGGEHYSTAALSLIASIMNNTGDTHIVNVPNGTTFVDLPGQAVIETPCRVDASGIYPLVVEPLPVQVRGLIEAVKAAEMLTIQAAITGDRRVALQALLAHPLVPSFAVAQSLLAALLAENRDYLPQFVGEGL
jgi:6-phospho-beta-glucosidase